MSLEFKLRPMVESDLDATLAMRNDPEVLRNAMTPEPVSEGAHKALFLYNNAIKLVFQVNGKPAGFVSITREPDSDEGEWAFHMAAEYRGLGLSIIMLYAALYYAKSVEGYTAIKSVVHKHNAVSKHLHYKLKFDYTGDKNNMHEYRLSL